MLRRGAAPGVAARLTSLALLLALAGCATGGGRGVPAAEDPPELDFLVALEHERAGQLPQALAAHQRALSKDPQAAPLLRRLAELSLALDRRAQAERYAQRALEVEPQNAELRVLLGGLYAARGDLTAARRTLTNDAGAPLNPDAASALYAVLHAAGRFAEARDTAAWLVEAEPDALRGPLALARAEQSLGDGKAAEEALREGLHQRPGSLVLYGQLASLRRWRGDREGELAVYREVLGIYPDHHATLLARGEAELALGRREESDRSFARVEARYPNDLRAVLRLAESNYAAGAWAAAARRFSHALRLQPGMSEVAFFLGVARRRLGDDAAALARFADIPPDSERYLDARLQAAIIWEGRGDSERALAVLDGAPAREGAKWKPRRARGKSRQAKAKQAQAKQAAQAARARPANAAALRRVELYRAGLLSRSGNLPAAIAGLEAMLRRQPRDADVLYNLGLLHGESGDSERALQVMHRAIESDPNHADALNYIGYTWAERGERLDEAEALIERALKQRPEEGHILDSLGWVYYMRARPLIEAGRVAEGRVWLRRAVVQLKRAAERIGGGGDPVISEHLGDAYFLLGRRREALQMYEEALRQKPRQDEQPDLRGKLDRLRVEFGKP